MNKKIRLSICFLMLIAPLFSIHARMTVDVWWANPHEKPSPDWKANPCKISYYDPDKSIFKLEAILTLGFGIDDGMLSDNLDFTDLVAKRIGDSLGISIIVRTGNTVYTKQYGQSTGIISDIKYKCYSRIKREKRPILYDTIEIPDHYTVYDTVENVRYIDSIITRYDTLIVNDTVIIPLHAEKSQKEKGSPIPIVIMAGLASCAAALAIFSFAIK
jgi:hypothetical protein